MNVQPEDRTTQHGDHAINDALKFIFKNLIVVSPTKIESMSLVNKRIHFYFKKKYPCLQPDFFKKEREKEMKQIHCVLEFNIFIVHPYLLISPLTSTGSVMKKKKHIYLLKWC